MKKSVSPSVKIDLTLKQFKRQMLIISDLDGTLLNDQSELSKFTIDVVKKISQQGHLFCIATGRNAHGSIDIYKKLNLKTVLVNLNGSYIWHPYDTNLSPINIVFNKELIRKLILEDNIFKHIDNIIAESYNAMYILNKPNKPKEIQELNELFRIDVNKTENQFYGKNHLLNMKNDPNTVLLQLKKSRYLDDVVYYIKQRFNTFVVRNWSLPNAGNIIEINTKFANKGNAIDFLMSYYGISMDSTISFGDGENDIELLRKARFGYAMKNGSSAAKLVARYITSKSNDKDGVAIELKKIFMK
ncbi:Cof-type HAD-IIB family hydrolase [Mycoplasmoides alvi]|uniref:Cof-type HAD-IIB family hydrolase n=1 Tax=Mycoplasmoides alvi TaxID=78580 RepID=UPI00069800F0|nr:Cof-type HAD-IIB family hydrolase [Mycoplasmoides alvi]